MDARRAIAFRMTLWAGLLAGLLVLALHGAPAHAATDFGFTEFDGAVLNAANLPETQAGVHPFTATTHIRFPLRPRGPGDADNDAYANVVESVRDLEVDLPPGFTGNPQAVPQCPRYLFTKAFGSCPASTQVGLVYTTTGGQLNTRGLFNLAPDRGTVAQFGFVIASNPAVITARVRPGDYGVSAGAVNIEDEFDVPQLSVQLWGVPGDPRHDARRVAMDQDACSGKEPVPDATRPDFTGVCPVTGTHFDGPVVPFVSNPAACDAGPLTTIVRGDSWEDPGDFKTASFISHDDASPANPIGVTGCDKLSFDPSITAQPSTSAADAPTGLEVKLAFPTTGLLDAGGLAEPPLKKAVVTLPEGMTINPSSADGLQACADASIGFGTDQAVSCPDGSKLGTVTASTPLLSEQVTGSVYLRSQASSDPESGAMFRIVLVLKNDERGLLFKLPGSIRADKRTGRLVTTFDNNPQVPVSSLSLTLKSGPRAPLATPPSCGVKTIDAELSSWAGQTVTRHDSFTVPCTAGLGGFAPTFRAGSVKPVGGAFSPFGLEIAKPDGNSDIDGLRMELPTGLLASVKGNIGTQIGSVKAFAGPGSNPFMLPGQVYLEGAYGDAPFSLKVVVPAKAGPFDLGEVVVRQKIYVDPIDAHVTVVSDPIPTIVSGVPVRLQRLEVDVDKPGFIVNPTSCAAKTLSATLSAVDGQSASVTNRFQVGECTGLDLKPTLDLSLSGKGQTTDGKHPAVSASLVQQPGQSNLKKVRVALPLSLALDPDNANGLCEFVDGSKPTPTCPKASIVGSVTATTPILDEPLTGPVYFVKNVRKDPKSGRDIRTLPKLVIPLVGQNGVKLTLTGTSAVEDDQLVTTFDNIPDAPVSSFKLNIDGGKGGILVVSGDKADICKSTQIADQQIDGQNNKQADVDVFIQTPSCPLKVLSKRATAKSVVLKVGGLGAGKVTVTGKGIKKTTKTITKSTVATITARRSKGKPGKVTVSFDPVGPVKARRITK